MYGITKMIAMECMYRQWCDMYGNISRNSFVAIMITEGMIAFNRRVLET